MIKSEQQNPAISTSVAKISTWPQNKSLRSFLIFLKFSAVGPPIGLIGLLIGFALFHVLDFLSYRVLGIQLQQGVLEGFWPDRIEYAIASLPFVLTAGFLPSYVLGGVQAAATGLISAIWAWRFDRLPTVVPLFCAAICALFFFHFMPSSICGLTNFSRPPDCAGIEQTASNFALAFAHIFAAGCVGIQVQSYFKVRGRTAT